MERRGMGANDGPLVPCRACWQQMRLDASQIEIVEARAYHRCGHCGASVLIRWEDAIALGTVPDPRPAQP